ncbi:putative LPS assembly protein LptD, partial [Candidatus Marinimicrobia bacterium]|nr:putative LPS assembly protein LptD [Candidatus Neomarinimicrobiota bacterium]
QLVYDIRKKVAVAYNNVSLVRDKTYLSCDTLYYWDALDSLEGFGKINVYEKDKLNNVTAGSIVATFYDSLSKKLNLYDSVEILNIYNTKINENSNMQAFENEIMGENILINIENDVIENLTIAGMAETHYHVIKDSILMGINKVSGDSIAINFKNNNMNRMLVKGGAIGKFIPEDGNSKVDSIVYYSANQIDYLIQQEKSILDKNANVDYGQTKIESGSIELDWNKNFLNAQKKYDDSPKLINTNESPMIGESMRFDLTKKKGVIRQGKTNFDDGYYQGRTIHREESNIMHMFDSKYTSCSLDHPHYYFGSNKMKMIQGDKIIAKPIVLYIADFPVMAFPFAILPNKGGGRRSGWIMPSYGNSSTRGNFLQNLGYYWAPNDYMDIKILSSIYDQKGFNIKSFFRYKKRYKYQGNIRSTFKRDLFETNDIMSIFTDSTKQDWDLRWIHSQTFDPYQKLNIDFTYITSNNFYQSENVGYDLETRLKQKIESSLNYTKSWPDQGNTMTVFLSESYDMLTYDDQADETPKYYKNRTLPKITFRKNSFKIFGEGNKWYNKIFGSASSFGSGTQRIGFYAKNFSQYDDGETFFDENGNNEYDIGEGFIDDKIDTTFFDSGITHNINFSYSNKIFKWISITPSVSLKESWIFKYKEYELDENNEFTDNFQYVKSYKRRLSGSLSFSMGTKLYGIIPFAIGRLNSFRHTLSPNITFSYLPDLSNNSNLFQRSETEIRDYFSGSIVGSTPTTLSRRYSLSIRNDIQVKYKNWSGNFEKKNLLNWTLNTSYNPDTYLKWSKISSSIQALIPSLFDLNISMTHDPYKLKPDPNSGSLISVNEFEPFPRLTYASFSTDLGLSGNEFSNSKNTFEENIIDTLDFDQKMTLHQSTTPYSPTIKQGKVWDAGLRLHYTLQSFTNQDQINWNKTFWVNSDINVKLTENWKMTYSSRFDLVENKIINHSLYLFRPLHCWEFSFKWWPTGNNKGFLLNIYVKNPDLRDVKIKSSGGSFFGL